MRNFYRRNLPVLLVLGIILALAGAARPSRQRRSRAGSWGLSFQQEGQPPVGNTTADRLRQYDAAFLGDTAQKRIYLTFDAGYENGCTAQILDALQKHHAPAAFFLVGNYIERNPDLVRRMAQEGHTVGNHTYHHWDMSKIGEMEQFRQELESLETLYRDTTGQELAKFYRPPQGIYSEKNLEMAQQLGYHTVFWSLAYVTGCRTISRRRSRPMPSSSRASTTEPLCCCTAPRRQMRPSSTVCSRAGRRWAIRSVKFPSCSRRADTGSAAWQRQRRPAARRCPAEPAPLAGRSPFPAGRSAAARDGLVQAHRHRAAGAANEIAAGVAGDEDSCRAAFPTGSHCSSRLRRG